MTDKELRKLATIVYVTAPFTVKSLFQKNVLYCFYGLFLRSFCNAVHDFDSTSIVFTLLQKVKWIEIMNTSLLDKDNSALFNLKYEDTVSSLSKACTFGNLRLITMLLERGCLPQTPDNRGWCAVHSCVAAKQLKALKLILNYKKGKRKFLANLCSWEGESPLIIAAKSNLIDLISLKIVKTLLKAGADPKIVTNEGMTALHFASKNKGNYKLVKLLVEYGSVVDAKEHVNGYTPLHFAIVEAADEELVKFLIDYGDVNLPDFDLETPLNKACVCNFVEAVDLILSKDVSSVNIIPKTGFSSLSAAALNGNIKMVELLLSAGADTTVKGPAAFHRLRLCPKDFMPIHSSIFVNVNIFKVLLERTDLHTLLSYEKDSNTDSLPIYTMMYASSIECFEILLQHHFPKGFEDLKYASFTKLTNFIEKAQDDCQLALLTKFKLFFKYCSNFEPEAIFKHFASLITDSQHTLCEKYELFYFLAKMGISSGHVFEAKCKIINLFHECLERSDEKERILEIISILKQPVLSLMQLSRVASRHLIQSKTGNDWMAYTIIRDSYLPLHLKNYLWYQF